VDGDKEKLLILRWQRCGTLSTCFWGRKAFLLGCWARKLVPGEKVETGLRRREYFKHFSGRRILIRAWSFFLPFLA
jgi:hypothetical protein